MQRSFFPAFAAACAAIVPAASAQDVLFVTDAGLDRVVSCRDANADGDLNDAGDITVFYDGVTGPVVLSNNVGICLGPGNSVLVCDSSTDVVLLLEDLNADGDALDALENRIYFDGRAGGNPQNVLMTSANSLYYDAATGKLWIATQNTGTAGTLDEILVVQDLNSDGDANDLGEIASWWTAPAGATNSYAPQAVVVEPGGRVIYVDSGVATNKGAYVLADLNSNGNANDPGERIPFFTLPVVSPVQQLFCLERDAQGWLYLADFQYDITYRFKDLDSDGDAMDLGESTNFFVPPVASTVWDLASTACGKLYVADGTTPHRTYELLDANNDGVIGAGEFSEIYLETGPNPVSIDNGRGIAVRGAPCATPSTPFCDGSLSGACAGCVPANTGAPGRGCANSSFANGTLLGSTGVASLASDTLVLTATDIPGPGLFFQANGLGAVNPFGDGMLCATVGIIRMGVVFPTPAFTASYPGGLTPFPISVAGAPISAGDLKHYQVWYRDSAVFCSTSTFNTSNGISLTWGP